MHRVHRPLPRGLELSSNLPLVVQSDVVLDIARHLGIFRCQPQPPTGPQPSDEGQQLPSALVLHRWAETSLEQLLRNCAGPALAALVELEEPQAEVQEVHLGLGTYSTQLHIGVQHRRQRCRETVTHLCRIILLATLPCLSRLLLPILLDARLHLLEHILLFHLAPLPAPEAHAREDVVLGAVPGAQANEAKLMAAMRVAARHVLATAGPLNGDETLGARSCGRLHQALAGPGLVLRIPSRLSDRFSCNNRRCCRNRRRRGGFGRGNSVCCCCRLVMRIAAVRCLGVGACRGGRDRRALATAALGVAVAGDRAPSPQ
mmetsp:Transcript_162552/g.521101  ORF Transcript_162552/g.521101 Transcript_162552/m.521101 type:complete len:317 (+) Transcript_162552:625-1575(+)